jgi:hypothetical protein
MAYEPNTLRKLRDLCEILHPLLYELQDPLTASEMLRDLENLLLQVSPDDGAIVTAEGFAIFHELKEDFHLALSYRQREVELMNQLYDEIRNNAFDIETKKMLLDGRGLDALAVREAIIHSLEQKCTSPELPEE